MSKLSLHAMSQTQLVTHALVLGLTAPSDKQMQRCTDIADFFAVGLTTMQFEACKSTALQIADGNIGGAA